MSKHGNIDKPKGSSLLGKPGFKHSGQPSGKSIGAGSSTRGTGFAEHHKGTSMGGASDCIKGATPYPSKGNQNIK